MIINDKYILLWRCQIRALLLIELKHIVFDTFRLEEGSRVTFKFHFGDGTNITTKPEPSLTVSVDAIANHRFTQGDCFLDEIY